jgi:hypothetical protein
MTLTQTAILTKQVIFFSILFLIIASAGFVGYQIWFNYHLSQIPPVEENPNLLFGKLPDPNFPDTQVASSNFTYSIDTVTGNLPILGEDPSFNKIIRVYYIAKPSTTFLSSERSRNLAKMLNIVSDPEIQSETTYLYQDLGKNLIINIDSGNFKFINDELTESKILDTDEQLANDFKNLLQNLELSLEDLDFDNTKMVALKREEDGKFIAVDTKNGLDFVQISFWPKSIDKAKIYTQQFNQSLVNAIVAGSAKKIDDYQAINFTSWHIDESTFATYPAKLLSKAFDDLKLGKGVVTIEPDKPQVSITSISFGYYLPSEYSRYLLPIYIFEGPNFAAYISAVSD